MATRYSKAPISELILGVIFNNDILGRNYVIFELLTHFKTEFPIYQMHPPIFEEELADDQVFQNINPMASGLALHRLWTADKKLVLQLQHNFILLNWRRDDDQRVGSYPGFESIFSKFEEAFKVVQDTILKYNPSLDLSRLVKAYTLHYQDRIFYNDYIASFIDLEKILNLKVPRIPVSKGEPIPANNIFSKYTIEIPELKGYSFITVNTAKTKGTNQKILIVECRMKGKNDSLNYKAWFRNAHDLQISFFENIFSREILETWAQ